MNCWRYLYVLIFVLFRLCRSAHIVVYIPLPFYSHQTAFKPLWLELAKRGHQITLIQCNAVIEGNENITNVVLSKSYDIMEENNIFNRLAEGESILTVLFTGVKLIKDVLEYQLMHPEVQKLIKGEKKVDLLFTEFLAITGIALGSKFKVPTIGIVSMDATVYSHMSVGNPTHPVIYPDRDLGIMPPLSFRERVLSTLFWISFQLLGKFILIPLQEQVLRKCVGEIEPTDKVTKNISLMFVNANPLFNNIRPLGPRTINIGGGVHLLDPKPLPKDIQDFLDAAEQGAIYFSLGSSITSKQISETTKKVICETFSQLPYNVLWKFEELPIAIPNNVKIMKWLPQQDILRHKNIKLLITQGGLQSMEEATFNYVPMIVLPFYGDQPNNANKMVSKGLGLSLDHTKLNVETFKRAILEVITNPKYRERTKQLADLVKDQPMSGLEKAIWWTEYVLRHGNTNHLTNHGDDIPWYQFLLLDVIAFFIFIILVTLFLLIKTMRCLKWFTLRAKNVVKTKRKIKIS